MVVVMLFLKVNVLFMLGLAFLKVDRQIRIQAYLDGYQVMSSIKITKELVTGTN